jgi:hypothetical protein
MGLPEKQTANSKKFLGGLEAWKAGLRRQASAETYEKVSPRHCCPFAANVNSWIATRRCDPGNVRPAGAGARLQWLLAQRKSGAVDLERPTAGMIFVFFFSLAHTHTLARFLLSYAS